VGLIPEGLKCNKEPLPDIYAALSYNKLWKMLIDKQMKKWI